jgi:hypothetical protein
MESFRRFLRGAVSCVHAYIYGEALQMAAAEIGRGRPTAASSGSYLIRPPSLRNQRLEPDPLAGALLEPVPHGPVDDEGAPILAVAK